MNYCCKKFEENTGTRNVGFEKPEPEKGNEYADKWHVNGCCGGGCYVLQDIKFCPFCGERLGWFHYHIKPSGAGYDVWRQGARGAHFTTKEEAENHVKMLQES